MAAILETVAYSIIGLAGFLFVGGGVFLAAVSGYERLGNWLVERNAENVRDAIPDDESRSPRLSHTDQLRR
jgi:hypothetical protein